MTELGKALLVLGMVIAVIGALVMAADRIGLPVGRVPGDMSYRGKSFSVYFPLGTSILVSILLSGLFYLLSRLHR